MPTYLCHGFRWHRTSIRVFVILRNIDDASPDWVIQPATARSLLDTFHTTFGFLPPKRSGVAAAATRKATARTGHTATASVASDSTVSSASTYGLGVGSGDAVASVVDGDVLAVQAAYPVKLLEEFDSRDTDTVSHPHAFVADYVARIDLSTSITDAMAAYDQSVLAQRRLGVAGNPAMSGTSPTDEGAPSAERNDDDNDKNDKKEATGWLERLRDQLQQGEDIRWYIVVNDDEQRQWPSDGTTSDSDSEDGEAAAEWPMQAQSGGVAAAAAPAQLARERALQKLRHDLGGFDSEVASDDGDEGSDVDGQPATAANISTSAPVPVAADAAAVAASTANGANSQRVSRADRRVSHANETGRGANPSAAAEPPDRGRRVERLRPTTASAAPPAPPPAPRALRPMSSIGGLRSLSGIRNRLSRSRSKSDAQRPVVPVRDDELPPMPALPTTPTTPTLRFSPPSTPPPPGPPPPIPSGAASPLRSQKSADSGTLRPKTPTSRGGAASSFRRLFGRSKTTHDASS